jgi:hypothetical protein
MFLKLFEFTEHQAIIFKKIIFKKGRYTNINIIFYNTQYILQLYFKLIHFLYNLIMYMAKITKIKQGPNYIVYC